MKYVYFIGIGGIGMSALARYYKYAGYIVSGYDKTESKLTKTLELEGIEIHYTDDIQSIPKDIESTLVIYTPAVKDLEELKYVKENGYKLMKRSQALGDIANPKHCLAVAGTHGKTTTSTMLAHLFTHSNTGCSAFMGGISKNYHSNLLLSPEPAVVVEADEFDRSFLYLYPSVAAITSTDADHLDIYGDVESIQSAFAQFASQIKENGALILKKGISIDLSNVKAKVYTYSFKEDADFSPINTTVTNDGYILFDLKYPAYKNLNGEEFEAGVIKECKVGIRGWVNSENGVAAVAIALIGGVPVEKIKEALATFDGVERRFDIHLNAANITYIDDYAHHPKEISSAISSIKNIFPNRRLTGIFQPHLYSRTQDFAPEFGESLNALDEIVLLDIYPARELPIEGVTSQIIFDKIENPNKVLISKEQVLEYVNNNNVDVLITFGAGDIDRLTAPITELLKEKYCVR